MPRVTMRDGAQLYVRVLGRGEPVLLLHGLGMKSSHWLPFVLPYLHRYRFYMPDFRGAGHSLPLQFNQPDVFQNHMEDVEDVVAHFGLRDFLLVGYSLGGSTALHWQRARGFAGVRRYLHIDQSPCIGNREDWRYGLFGERQADLFAALRELDALLAAHADVHDLRELPGPVRGRAIAILARTLSRVLGRPAAGRLLKAAAPWPAMLGALLPVTRLADIRAYLQAYVSGGHDYRESLQQCEVPVTVMVGMRSPLYHPAGQMAIARHVPEADVVRLHNSGHAPFLDEPLRFTREFGLFLHGKPRGHWRDRRPH